MIGWHCCGLVALSLLIGATPPAAKGDPAKTRPTEVVVNPKLNGAALRLHEEVAKAFTRQSPQPRERSSHFQWIDAHGPRLSIASWQCRLQGVEKRDGKDGWIVTVVVAPVLNVGGAAAPGDVFSERYIFTHGTFRFVDGNGPATPHRVITFN